MVSLVNQLIWSYLYFYRDGDILFCKLDDIVKPAALPLKKRCSSLKCGKCDKSMLSLSALNYHKKKISLGHNVQMSKLQKPEQILQALEKSE